MIAAIFMLSPGAPSRVQRICRHWRLAGMKRRRLSILLILVISFLLTFCWINAYGFDLSAIDASASRENDTDDTEDSPDAQLNYTGAEAPLRLSSPSFDHHLFTSRISFSLLGLPVLFSASTLRC